MCTECRMSPCHPNCPNAVPDGMFECASCGEVIEYGTEYVEIGDHKYCFCCIDNMTTNELIEAFGGDVKTAERPDPYEDEDPYDGYGDERW